VNLTSDAKLTKFIVKLKKFLKQITIITHERK